MWNTLRPAVVSFAALTIITGAIYPAIVSGFAKLAFPAMASGSVIEREDKAVGSSLIAQPFTDAKYFWPRPSAAGTNGYDATSGSGSNLGPSNPALADAVAARIAALKVADPSNVLPIPVDLVTASASGLDPHISAAAANYQLARVARARQMTESQLQKIVDLHTQRPSLGVLGETSVNVLELNLELDHPAAQIAVATRPAPFVGYRAAGFAIDAK